jgi:hypothetical protein
MTNKTKFLVIASALIGIGAALLFFGSQSITADIVIEEGQIDKTNSIKIDVVLDPEINVEGVFVVQTLEENEGKILAIVLDPNDVQIVSASINQRSFEEIFEISQMGTYALIIKTQSNEMLNVVGGIGHVPDSSSYSISMAGFFILLLGMLGVLIIGVILVKERKKKLS